MLSQKFIKAILNSHRKQSHKTPKTVKRRSLMNSRYNNCRRRNNRNNNNNNMNNHIITQPEEIANCHFKYTDLDTNRVKTMNKKIRVSDLSKIKMNVPLKNNVKMEYKCTSHDGRHHRSSMRMMFSNLNRKSSNKHLSIKSSAYNRNSYNSNNNSVKRKKSKSKGKNKDKSKVKSKDKSKGKSKGKGKGKGKGKSKK